MEPISKAKLYRVINNKAKAKEAEEVAQWLATNEGQTWLAHALANDAELIDKNILPLEKNIPVEDILKAILQRIKRRKYRRIFFTCAAAIIPCILLVTMWININNRLGGALLANKEKVVVTVDKGKKKEIVFQDGSSVILNSGTNISYPQRFGLGERRIRLDGEAFFNVQSNNLRPFIVEMCTGTEVKVLGTTFNISAYEENPSIDVTLIDGSIEFSADSQKIIMNPSECLSYTKATKTAVINKVRDPQRSSIWTENILIFRDTPLKEALNTLGRQFNVDFQIIDEHVKSYSYSLRTSPDASLNEILKDFESISSIRFVKKDSVILVYSR